MAIEQSLPTSVHVDATYHRIASVQIDWIGRNATVIVVGTANQAAREAGAGSLLNQEIVLSRDEFPFTDDMLAKTAAAFLIPDTHAILNEQVTYDTDVAHVRIAYDKVVLGIRQNSDEQYSVPKASMPTDYLAILYPIVTAKLFIAPVQV